MGVYLVPTNFRARNANMTKKSVVIYSGGMDSFTLLNQVIEENGKDAVFPLTFDYGQKHAKELDYARAVCKKLGLIHHVIDLKSITPLLQGSALTSNIPVPEGHYEDASMKATFVPNRNMILLSLAIGYADSIKSESVYYGAHAGDHAIYPDCRTEFVEKMDDVARIANYQAIAIKAPYLSLSKHDILEIGLNMGLDYGQTWTCYNGREKACGRCGSCVERLEAFAQAGQTDPLSYE